MKRGDFVKLSRGDQQVEGMIVLASDNGGSLMVMFDGMIGGYVGMIPLLRNDDGSYQGIIDGAIIHVELSL